MAIGIDSFAAILPDPRSLSECAAAQNFLESPNENTFAAAFSCFAPQLTSFFSARGCETVLIGKRRSSTFTGVSSVPTSSECVNDIRVPLQSSLSPM